MRFVVSTAVKCSVFASKLHGEYDFDYLVSKAALPSSGLMHLGTKIHFQRSERLFHFVPVALVVSRQEIAFQTGLLCLIRKKALKDLL
jgi:hypothetical protein